MKKKDIKPKTLRIAYTLNSKKLKRDVNQPWKPNKNKRCNLNNEMKKMQRKLVRRQLKWARGTWRITRKSNWLFHFARKKSKRKERLRTGKKKMHTCLSYSNNRPRKKRWKSNLKTLKNNGFKTCSKGRRSSRNRTMKRSWRLKLQCKRSKHILSKNFRKGSIKENRPCWWLRFNWKRR